MMGLGNERTSLDPAPEARLELYVMVTTLLV